MNEEWRSVPGYEGYWVASSHGRVARVCGFSSGNGYELVSTRVRHQLLTKGRKRWKGNNSFNVSIHRMVALAFLGEPPEGKSDVNHKDGDRGNNYADNLEWCSRGDNLRHGVARRRREDPIIVERHKQYAEALALRKQGWLLTQIEKRFGWSRAKLIYALYPPRREGEEKPWQRVA